MQVRFFCPLWGSENLSMEAFLTRVKAAGYDGVEMSLPLEAAEREAVLACVAEHDLQLIGQHWETRDMDLAAHKAGLERRLRNLAEARPLFINSHTGRDMFPLEQNLELLRLAQSIAEETGVAVIHETHRGRFSFAAHVTRRFLEELDGLRLALDVSHWMNVAETLLEDQPEALDLAIARTEHIHSRIGFEQGPQVPDPRAPEWQPTVDRHVAIWDRIIARARDEGRETFTIVSEFGPPPYMPIEPVTRKPMSDQWDVNVYMKDLLQARYNDTPGDAI